MFRAKCKPKKNIVFVKTHKTGSSTVTNILHRYGDKHNLVFALPRDGQFRLNWPWSMRNDSFDLVKGVRPNIICHHGRYNRETLEQIMPRDTVYVTILRDPVSQYESTFSYMGFDKLLGITEKGNPLVNFLENPDKILVHYLLNEDLRVHSDRLKLIRNGMAFDLGLNSSNFDNSVEIEHFLEKVKKEFDLVLLAEFFDESLVLLKNLLCWPPEDLTYFKLNERHREENKTNFSAKAINDLRKWNNVDFLLYRQFRDILKEEISKNRRTKDRTFSFATELKELRTENARMRELCLRNVTKTSTLQYGVVMKKLELNGGLDAETRTKCDKIRQNEVDYIKYLREKQSGFASTFLNRAKNAVVNLLRLLLGFLSKT